MDDQKYSPMSVAVGACGLVAASMRERNEPAQRAAEDKERTNNMTDTAIVSGGDIVGYRVVWQSTNLPVMSGNVPNDNGGVDCAPSNDPRATHTRAKLEGDVVAAERDYDYAPDRVEAEHAKRETAFGGVD
jgi:hypothetical protein